MQFYVLPREYAKDEKVNFAVFSPFRLFLLSPGKMIGMRELGKYSKYYLCKKSNL